MLVSIKKITYLKEEERYKRFNRILNFSGKYNWSKRYLIILKVGPCLVLIDLWGNEWLYYTYTPKI